jgi:hypothetical protein
MVIETVSKCFAFSKPGLPAAAWRLPLNGATEYRRAGASGSTN